MQFSITSQQISVFQNKTKIRFFLLILQGLFICEILLYNIHWYLFSESSIFSIFICWLGNIPKSTQQASIFVYLVFIFFFWSSNCTARHSSFVFFLNNYDWISHNVVKMCFVICFVDIFFIKGYYFVSFCTISFGIFYLNLSFHYFDVHSTNVVHICPLSIIFMRYSLFHQIRWHQKSRENNGK